MAHLTRRQATVAAAFSVTACMSGSVLAAQDDKDDPNLPKDVAGLLRLLKDPNPQVRKQAAVALEAISQAIKAGLQNALPDPDPGAKEAIGKALATMKAAKRPCEKCIGSGKVTGACSNCAGNGARVCQNSVCKGTGKVSPTLNCPDCNGKGSFRCIVCGGAKQTSSTCAQCKGAGTVINE